MTARTVHVDEVTFLGAFGRDVDFHDATPQSTYLDLETGDVIWVYDYDDGAYMEAGIPPEDNRSLRKLVASASHRYLTIPGRDHGEHHKILREFLASDSIEDPALRAQAQEAYFGSIGGWIKEVADQGIVDQFYQFRDDAVRARAEAFLQDHGVQVIWR